MSSGKLVDEHAYTGCTVTVKSVKIAKLFLNRVRVWDSTGRQLIAMRVWSDTPFESGMLMNMQPSVAPRSNVSLAAVLEALEGTGLGEPVAEQEVLSAAKDAS